MLRTTILAVFFLFGALFFTVFSLTFPAEFNRVFQGTLHWWLPPIFFSIVAAYLLGVRTLAAHFLRTSRPYPTIGRYMNAILETSIPTLVLIFMMQFRNPFYVLLMPPVYVYFIFIILSALRVDRLLSIFTGFVAALEYGALSIYALLYAEPVGMDPALAAPGGFLARFLFLAAAGITTGFVTRQIKRQLTVSFEAGRERDKIADLFGQHVSPQVVDRLLSQNTEWLSESRHVCMMFLDIRDFTRFSQNRDPEQVVNYLNSLFDFMIEMINEHQGYINKFLGDGFMAVFGAPISSGADVQNAVAAALKIVERVDSDSAAGIIAPTRVGVGIHAGIAVTGHVGTTRKKEYTIIGDVVNLASRIEQLNKEFGSKILVSEDVWKELKDHKGEELGTVTVKGRDEAVRIFKLA